LSQIPDVSVVGERGGGVEIDTPRYDLFTRILVAIARQGARSPKLRATTTSWSRSPCRRAVTAGWRSGHC
jgi:hypothetical protein